MNFYRKSLLALGLATVASGAIAAEKIILTGEASKSGRNFVSLDLDSDGTAAGFSFVVDLPSDASNIDIKGCLADLPKSHTGECRVVKGNRLAVIAFSMQNALLSPGVVSLGNIAFDTKMKASNLVASQVTLASPPQGARQQNPADNLSTRAK